MKEWFNRRWTESRGFRFWSIATSIFVLEAIAFGIAWSGIFLTLYIFGTQIGSYILLLTFYIIVPIILLFKVIIPWIKSQLKHP